MRFSASRALANIRLQPTAPGCCGIMRAVERRG